MTRLFTVPLAGAFALLLAAAGCGGSSTHDSTGDASVTIRIPDPGNEGLLALGKKDGSLAKALAVVHAKVAWTGSSGPFAPAAQELGADKLDVAQGSITSAIAALAQHPGFKLFAQIAPNKTGEGILVRKGSPIASVRDLAGRKVAVNKGGTAEYLLLKALASAGVPAGRVTRVYLNPAQTAPVFNSGQVDAWAVWSTYSIPEIASTGARFVATGGQIGSQNYSVWAVRNGFADAHPAVVQAFSRYLHDAGVRQAQNPASYVNVFTDAGPQAVSGTARRLTIQDLAQTAAPDGIRPSNVTDFDAVARFFAEQKITPTAVNVRPYVLSLTGSGS
ncbi:NrtA/SsuA/CpmA family ABC transporter substrate-binding protein [Actinoallomurus rhizosphaericola]|uniref:NrtA/SsuA/CpmA family ABC transporter substrate-binding protein n=1 Tax=Actinoallomurus rhizosphaericola TaxID=2952536 RepID=UPI002091D0F1|nr:NrtA/SsuA/CpmA family ABC transporter substrate-binding protein [Actinoallomurus rhizosphaericola]MCO5992404.1 NrtA/SsuA/CpmA family ABC transporter substrate-binding protein [Actinoallomurus rhizosphaericola]